MNEESYKTRYGANFPTPARPAIYDVKIPINATNAVQDRREDARTAKKEDYRLFATAERESTKFILAIVEDTWVRELRDPDLFYTAVKPRVLLAHLQTLCVDLHAIDMLNLQNEMQTYHDEMEGVPTYINMLKDAQKQSNKAGNPITDPTFLLFASNTMLRTDRFPWANEIWEDLSRNKRKWARWKIIYRKADMADKIKKAAKGRQDYFGDHGAFDKVPTPEAPEALTQLSVEELDCYVISFANAAITEKDILAAIVKSNATLTSSNATLTATVANLQKQLANLFVAV